MPEAPVTDDALRAEAEEFASRLGLSLADMTALGPEGLLRRLRLAGIKEEPVTDDALVEEIARVIWDGDPAHYNRHWQEHSQEQARRALAHLRERGMLVEVTTMPQPTPEEFARAVAEGEARGLAVAAAVRGLRGKQPLPAAPTGETE